MTFAWVILLAYPGSVLAHGDVHAQILALTAKIDCMGARAQCTNIDDQARDKAMLLHKRGELHRAHGDFAAALDDYRLALVCNPKLDVLHLSRGRVLVESGEAAAALAALHEFLNAQPSHEEGLYLSARAWQRLGEHEKAEAIYAQLQQLTRDPTPDFFLERAANLAQAGQVDRALAALEGAIERLGNLPSLMDAALLLEEGSNRHEAAIQRLGRWIKINPDNLQLWARKAVILGRMRRFIEAERLRGQAVQAIMALPPHKQATLATKHLKAKLQSMTFGPTANARRQP